MSAATAKIWRDLPALRSRALLVMASIAVGVAAFTSVLSSYPIVGRELDRGYLGTLPASAILVTDAVDPELLAAAGAQEGVVRAEVRGRQSGRIRAARGEWRNLRLFVLPDFERLGIGRIARQEGAYPPGPGEIAIERDAFGVLGGRIGDEVRVKTAGGRETGLRLTGSVRDVGQAQARMERMVYGYVTPATLELLGEEPRLGRLLLRVDRPADPARIEQVAASTRRLAEAQGHPVYELELPPPGRHPHADLMDLLLRTMATFGAAILALSGVAAFTATTATLAGQMRQIGVMKALGASRAKIAGIYLAQAAMLGAAAVLLGLPIGLWGCRLLTGYLARFLNFDMESYALPFWVFALVALAGIATPVLAAAWPVFRGVAVPVLTALADTGAGSRSFGESRLDCRLAGWSGSARPLLLGLRNAFRRRTRLLLTVATLTLSGLFFLCGLDLRLSLIRTIDRIFEAKNFDLVVVLAGEVDEKALEPALRGLAGYAGAEIEKPDSVNVARPVTRVAIRRQNPDPALLPAFTEELESRLEAAGLRTIFLTSKAESRYGYDQHLIMIYAFLLIVAAILAGVGGLGLATAMSLAVRERRREIAILRAIGAGPAAILAIFGAEGALIGGLGWAFAALLAGPLGRFAGGLLTRAVFRSGLEYAGDPRALWLWLALSLLLGVAASLGAARRALRQTLAVALAYE